MRLTVWFYSLGVLSICTAWEPRRLEPAKYANDVRGYRNPAHERFVEGENFCKSKFCKVAPIYTNEPSLAEISMITGPNQAAMETKRNFIVNCFKTEFLHKIIKVLDYRTELWFTVDVADDECFMWIIRYLYRTNVVYTTKKTSIQVRLPHPFTSKVRDSCKSMNFGYGPPHNAFIGLIFKCQSFVSSQKDVNDMKQSEGSGLPPSVDPLVIKMDDEERPTINITRKRPQDDNSLFESERNEFCAATPTNLSASGGNRYVLQRAADCTLPADNEYGNVMHLWILLGLCVVCFVMVSAGMIDACLRMRKFPNPKETTEISDFRQPPLNDTPKELFNPRMLSKSASVSFSIENPPPKPTKCADPRPAETQKPREARAAVAKMSEKRSQYALDSPNAFAPLSSQMDVFVDKRIEAMTPTDYASVPSSMPSDHTTTTLEGEDCEYVPMPRTIAKMPRKLTAKELDRYTVVVEPGEDNNDVDDNYMEGVAEDVNASSKTGEESTASSAKNVCLSLRLVTTHSIPARAAIDSSLHIGVVMNTTSLPDDVLIRIVKFLDFKSKLSFRGVSHRIREICAKYGPKERIVLEHTRERRDPNAPRRVLLAYEDESEYDKVLEGPMFGKASKSAKDLDDVFARIPTDLFEIVEVTTSLSEEKQKERRTRRSDFTLDELCELADKYKKLFNVNRICIDNGDMTDDHQFNEFKHIISVFARPGTDLRLFLGVGGHLKEVIDLMQEKQIQTKLMLLNAESVADVELIQSLLLSEPNGILAEKVHLQMNIIEQIEKDDFVVMMDCFVRRFCEHGKLLIDSVSFDFPSHQQSNYLPEERVRVTYHPSKRCPHVGYQTMIDFRGYTINLVQNIPSLSIPVEKIRGFAIENNQLRIHAKEGIIVHAEVYPVARNLSREADILKQDQVAIYQIRPTDTHVWIWYCLTNSDDSHDIPIGAFHYRHFEEPRVVRSLSDSCPFDLKII